MFFLISAGPQLSAATFHNQKENQKENHNQNQKPPLMSVSLL